MDQRLEQLLVVPGGHNINQHRILQIRRFVLALAEPQLQLYDELVYAVSEEQLAVSQLFISVVQNE